MDAKKRHRCLLIYFQKRKAFFIFFLKLWVLDAMDAIDSPSPLVHLPLGPSLACIVNQEPNVKGRKVKSKGKASAGSLGA